MSDLIDLLNLLKCGILKVNAPAKWSRHRDVHVLVDRGSEQESFMAPVVGCQIGTASAEGNTKWTARHYHLRIPLQSAATDFGSCAPDFMLLSSRSTSCCASMRQSFVCLRRC